VGLGTQVSYNPYIFITSFGLYMVYQQEYCAPYDLLQIPSIFSQYI
jgi:hypothetical protein